MQSRIMAVVVGAVVCATAGAARAATEPHPIRWAKPEGGRSLSVVQPALHVSVVAPNQRMFGRDEPNPRLWGKVQPEPRTWGVVGRWGAVQPDPRFWGAVGRWGRVEPDPRHWVVQPKPRSWRRAPSR